MKFNFYNQLKECILSKFRKEMKLPKKMKPEIRKSLFRKAFQISADMNALDSSILLDEESWNNSDRTIFLVEDNSLLEMLNKSKFEIHVDDLKEFPETFQIAFPKDNPFKLTGCNVWFGNMLHRQKIADTINKQLNLSLDLKGLENIHGLHVTYSNSKGSNSQFSRASIQEDLITSVLESPERMLETVGRYESNYAIPLNAEEMEYQHTMVKMVLFLMTYIKACPESVIDGFPDSVGKTKTIKNVTKKTLTMPKESGSKSTHLRNAYFRQYPKRKDGTRKKGIVFVSSCLVNSKANPKTVRNKK